LAYVLLLCTLAQRSWKQPLWEWDVLGYAGCVAELRGDKPEALQRAVYAELDRVAPAAVAEKLRGSIPYRATLAADPKAFNAQLPFYRGRVFFIGLLAGLDQLGLSPLRAVFAISLVSGLLFGGLLCLWLMGHLPPSLAVLASLFVVAFGGVTEVMAMGTPDMLAAMLLLAGAYVLIETERRWLALVLGLAALATRTDHLLFVVPLLVGCTWSSARGPARITKAQLAGALAACLAVVWFCTAGRHTYSWWVVFHHTFVEYKTFPRQQTPALDLALAVRRSVSSLPMFKAGKPLVFGGLAVLAVVLGWRKGRAGSWGVRLGVVSSVATLAHFALFPALWPRLMLGYWALGVLAACAAVGEGRSSCR